MKRSETRQGLTVKDALQFAGEDNFDDIVIIGKRGNGINYYISSDNFDDSIGILERVKIDIINTIDK